MTSDQQNVPIEIEQALSDTYSGLGVRIWWNSRNAALGWVSPSDYAARNAESARIVADYARHLGDGAWA